MPNFDFDEMQQMVTDGAIGAISLDTSIFDQFACNLDSPSLEALEQFVGSSVSIGVQSGPPIGVQKEPLCVAWIG